ncbi:hypothetical protein PTKU46_80560 [Paraburkholderia terrae]|jgi:hypothetical protein
MNRRIVWYMVAVLLAVGAAGRKSADAATGGLRDAATPSLGKDGKGCCAHPRTGASTTARYEQGIVPDRLSADPFMSAQRPLNGCSGTGGSESGISPVNATPGHRHVIFIWPML